MEFKLLEPKNEKGFLKNVEFNFEDLRCELEKSLEKYEGIVYEVGNLKQAKRDRANLNRLKILFEDERKKIKNLCLLPYFEFEKKIKVLERLIDEPIIAIDSQIKIFEEERRNRKKAILKNFYLTSEKTLSKKIDFDTLLNDYWFNSTFSFKEARCELSEKIKNIKKEIKMIKNFKSPMEDFLLETYFERLDFDEVTEKKDLLEREEKSFRKKIKKRGKTFEKTFKIVGTKTQFLVLEDFMSDCGIEFQKV